VSTANYIIEELFSQDPWGIIYHASDAKLGQHVELQRFFPYQSAELGMEPDAIQRYVVTINFMRFWRHQSVRKVLDGGCDPIDQIPYLVSEARSPTNLAEMLGMGTLSMVQGKQLAEQALLLLIELDDVFRSTAPWISFRPEDIDVFDDGTKFRFCIVASQLVEPKYEVSAIKELASLVEMCMGWSGRVVTGSTLGTLSGWVRQTRSKSYSAKQALALLQGNKPDELTESTPQPTAPSIAPALQGSSSTPTGSLVTSPTGLLQQGIPHPPLASLKKKSPLPWVIATALILLGGAVTLFMQSQKKNQEVASAPKTSLKDKKSDNSQETPQPVSNSDAIASEPTKVATASPSAQENPTPKPLSADEQRRADIVSKSLKMQADFKATQQQKAAAANKPKAGIKPKTAKRNGDYKPDEVGLIGEHIGQTVSIVGKLFVAKPSNTGKTFYLRFSEDQRIAGGRHVLKNALSPIALKDLQLLVGKTIRVKGVVNTEPTLQGPRITIDFTQLKDIEVIQDAPK
jgi:hypothetical protein